MLKGLFVQHFSFGNLQTAPPYFFFRLMAAWAAANRAIGTRKGEQEP
jgi:hypothetical protein